MKNKRGSAITFVNIFFITICFIMMTAYLYPMVVENKEFANCVSDYTLNCILLDLSLPMVVIILLSLLIGFVARKIKK